MSKILYFRDIEHRDAVFREVFRLVRVKLPAGISDLTNATKPGDNWMKLSFTEWFPSVTYELHFATSQSEQHGRYFGSENKIVLALYFDNLIYRDAWLKAMKPYKQQIEDQLGEKVVLELWGEDDDYVILGKKLDFQKLGVEPEGYANEIAWFIQSTFQPVWMVSEGIKGNP